MKSIMKRILALALVIVLCVGAIPVSASAATTSLPTISTSCYIKCYPQSSTTLYTNTDLTKTYKTIDKTTCCYIVGISTSYVKVRLSTSGTTYYAKPSAFSSGTLKNKTAIATYTATTSVSTYRQKAATTSYGTIDKGDKVYLLYEPSNSEWIQVLYPINSGKQYYMGWCKTGELYTGALTVSKTSATLSAKGKTTTVTASFPSELGLTVTWTTSDSSIATVTTKSTTSSSSTATVTAKTSTNGKTATITAKFYNGTSVVAKKTMKVTIKTVSESTLVSTNLSKVNFIEQDSKTCKATALAMSLNLLVGKNTYSTSSMLASGSSYKCKNINDYTYTASNGTKYTATYQTDDYIGSAAEQKKAIEAAISAGVPIVVAVHSSSAPHHWIIIYGKDSSGEYLIIDPSSGTTGDKLSEYGTKTMSSAGYSFGLTDYSKTHYGYITFTEQ